MQGGQHRNPSRSRALGVERLMGTAAYGGKGFKERARISVGGPIGAASFRKQSTQESCHPQVESYVDQWTSCVSHRRGSRKVTKFLFFWGLGGH